MFSQSIKFFDNISPILNLNSRKQQCQKSNSNSLSSIIPYLPSLLLSTSSPIKRYFTVLFRSFFLALANGRITKWIEYASVSENGKFQAFGWVSIIQIQIGLVLPKFFGKSLKLGFLVSKQYLSLEIIFVRLKG